MEPPNFKIASFTDHMNVTVEFPPVLPKIMYREGLWFHLSPVIEEESGNIVKKVGGANSSELAMNTLDALL